jgi:cell division septation protein DedD
VTTRTHDDGFHEIQLSGKQLVFLFMAASVVAGVIFLLGVFVGRGVRVERGTIAQAAALSEAPVPDVVRMPSAPVEAAPAATDPTAAAPPPPVDDLSYFDRLDKDVKDADKPRRAASPVADIASPPKTSPVKSPAKKPSTDETSVAARTAPAAAVAPAAAAAPTPARAPVVPVATDVAATVPPASGAPGDGYAVQVAALNVRSEADAIVKRLASKGYAAYVQVPSGGGGSVFRVRVGMFKSKREAETVAARLEKEERITPWVTR